MHALTGCILPAGLRGEVQDPDPHERLSCSETGLSSQVLQEVQAGAKAASVALEGHRAMLLSAVASLNSAIRVTPFPLAQRQAAGDQQHFNRQLLSLN